MPVFENVDKVSTRNELWPTIADALDTFLRRYATGAHPYERIWRLIHVWESTSITLAAAAMSRIRVSPTFGGLFLRCREYCYGRQWDRLTKQFKNSQGALQGSIDQWIDILWEVSKVDTDEGFLGALRRLLDADEIRLGPLVQAWSLACDVPSDSHKNTFTVKQAMRHVNTFRNRFAHVPFPHDPLNKIADALELITEELFSVEPLPWKVLGNGQPSSALVGGLLFKGRVLRGSLIFPSDGVPSEQIMFVHPGRKTKADDSLENWNASPFVYIDHMMRPHILTRVKDETVATWEYTRFRAEANALITRDNKDLLKDLSPPKMQEYDVADEDKEAAAHVVDVPQTVTDASLPAQPAVAQSFGEAIDAMRAEEYDKAIPFFSSLTRERPTYHIGWLRLGVALREKAVRLPDLDHDKAAIDVLNEAIEAFTKASGHIDPDYQAQAFYHRSKAHYHLARRCPADQQQRSAALEDSEHACELSADPEFARWREHLERVGFLG